MGVSAQMTQADTELSEQCTNISFIHLCPAVTRAGLTHPPGEAESPHEPPAALEPSPHSLQHLLHILRAGEGFSQMETVPKLVYIRSDFTARACKSLGSLVSQ